jgi:hypothetical protein
MTQTVEHRISAALPRFAISLRPHGPAVGPDQLDVSITASGVVFAPGKPAVKLSIYAASIKSVEVPAASVKAFDRLGGLTVTGQDEDPDPSGFLYHRLYSFDRETEGDVTLQYTAPAGTTSERKPGPPFDLISNNGGISGNGVSFLLVPTLDSLDWDFQIDWDLSAMPAGTSAATSLGGAVTHYVGRSETIQFGFYMAGPLISMLSQRPPQVALNGYWLGQPRFNVEAVMRWVEVFYQALAKRLPNSLDRPFHVLGRLGSIPRSGGAAALNSFMIGYGTEPEDDIRIKFLLAHELSHPLAGGMEDAAGEFQQWYAEGLAEFYKLKGPHQSGLATDDEVLDEFAKSTRYYYSCRLINMPNTAIRGLFWVDSAARKLPYARGLLYFLALNLRMLEKTGGVRSLDDLVNEMQCNTREGRPHDLDTWRALLVRELGEGELALLDAMSAGATQIPPAGIFGDGITRKEISLRVIDFGLKPSSFREGVVSELREDSAAYRAGLREGDRIEAHNYPNSDEVYPQDRPIQMRVSRGGETLELEYLPHGTEVLGYEWIKAGH